MDSQCRRAGACLGRAAERNGLGYQRGKIQEESLHYEHLKHIGEYPIIGVNTFRNPNGDHVPEHVELAALDRRREAKSVEAAERIFKSAMRSKRRRCCKGFSVR